MTPAAEEQSVGGVGRTEREQKALLTLAFHKTAACEVFQAAGERSLVSRRLRSCSIAAE